MPFPFIYVCDLLDKLEQPYLRDAPYLPVDLRRIVQNETIRWFQRHKDNLNAFSTSDATVMSMLRPEVWTDRDYGWDRESLEPLIARLLGLTRSQRVDLHKWKTKPWTGDMGAQVARILENMKRNTASALTAKVDVEDIEIILLSIASHNEGSSDLVKGLASACDKVVSLPLDGLKTMYDQLQPREAKWLTRLLLKTTGLVTVPADFGVSSYQSQLPNCVKVHVELPASSPPVLQIGITGAIKISLPQQQTLASEKASTIIQNPVQKPNSRRSPSLREDSPETGLKTSIRDFRRLGEMSSMKRRVSRPRSPLKPWDGPLLPVQTSKSPTTPDPVEPPLHEPPEKRRRISRDASPDALIFARGILKPLRLTELPFNSFTESAGSSQNQSNGHSSTTDMRSGKGNSVKCPTFYVGGSNQVGQTQRQSSISSNMPTPPKSSPARQAVDSSPARHRKIPVANKPEAQESFVPKLGLSRSESCESEIMLALQTPPSSDATSNSPARPPISQQVSASEKFIGRTDLCKIQVQTPGPKCRVPSKAPIPRQVSVLANEQNVSVILTTKKPPNITSGLPSKAPISRQVSMLTNELNAAALSMTGKSGVTSECPIAAATRSRDATTALKSDDCSVISTSKGHTISGSTHACKLTSTQTPTAHVAPPLPRLNPRTLPDPTCPLLRAGTGTCTLATTTCPLINAIFFVPPTLPPVVTTRILTTLLPHHGAFYLLSTPHLAHPSLPRRCLVTRLKYRKIVLVEPAETQEMLSVLRGVRELELKRSQGRKFWVECFDWRLLEGVGRRECGIEGSGANVWERNWMCCV